MGTACSGQRSSVIASASSETGRNTYPATGSGNATASVRPVNLNDIPTFKIVLIGDPGTGKTSVFLRYAHNRFDHNYRPTRKAYIENIVKKVNVPGNTVASIALWDLPGREDMDMRETYYRNVDAAIVVVDMTDPVSIEMAATWKQDFLNKVSCCRLLVQRRDGVDVTRVEQMPCEPSQIPVLLLGNKYDLIEEEEQTEKLKELVEASSMQEHLDINQAVEDMFRDGETGDVTQQQQSKRSDTSQVEVNLAEDGKLEREFTPQRGPKAGQRKPECVKQLERVEKDHRFVGSIIVAAKDTDNSVHAAVQSVVRYMLERTLPPPLRQQREQKKRAKSVEVEDEYRLTKTGVEEIDDVAERCYLPMRRAADYLEYYQLVLKRFKQTCADMGLLSEFKASLEDCIIGIRDTLHDATEHQLTAETDGDFVVLDFQEDRIDVKVAREIEIAMRVFNVEYAPLCKVILRDCPIMSTVLKRLDHRISHKMEQLDTLMPLATGHERARVFYLCERNRARISITQTQITECLQLVRNAKEKVRHALIW